MASESRMIQVTAATDDLQDGQLSVDKDPKINDTLLFPSTPAQTTHNTLVSEHQREARGRPRGGEEGLTGDRI